MSHRFRVATSTQIELIEAALPVHYEMKYHLENCSVGAMSLVTKSCNDFVILAGIPAKPIKERIKRYLELEKTL